MALPPVPAILSRRTLTAEEFLSQPEARVRLHAWMHLARTADNRILELFRQGLIRGTVTGGQGNEALIVPLTLLANKTTDVVSFTHRDLGGHLIWSGHLVDHLDQYCANASSPTRAREGNVHHGDPANRSLPMISHLGAMLSNVLGLTDAQRRRDTPAVGFAFFGDGASSTGDIHECLNLASLLSLPILFVIENNGYAYSTPVKEQFAPGTELWKRASAYQMEGWHLDATGPLDTTVSCLARAIAHVRESGRPLLLEARVLRLRGHAAYDTCDYLAPGEADGFFAADPLPRYRQSLIDAGQAAAVAAAEAEVGHFVEDCIRLSLGKPRPSPEGMADDLFVPQGPPLPWTPAPSAGAPQSMAQALNSALRKILEERPESLILGQDIGTYGGAFKVTEGLLKSFGRARVLNTPLAESACTGYAVGLALGGLRPIEEFQFADFATEATTQITLNAATYHFRSGARVPLVLRLPCGGGLTFGSFHSQELEALFLGMPGLKALYPSTPQDAFDALLAAYEDENPVLLFEHKGLYRRLKQPVGWNPDYRTVWLPRRLREGTFATLVTYGEMTLLAQEAADYLAQEYERTFDVWDLRALSPLRLDPILASLRRTHRLIVLHEGRRTHGFGAELVSRLVEETFHELDAAPLRLASLDLPVPFAPELEAEFRPTFDKVVNRIVAWMG
jgi:2-oxoisovalerate dehydrogenase E1 component